MIGVHIRSPRGRLGLRIMCPLHAGGQGRFLGNAHDAPEVGEPDGGPRRRWAVSDLADTKKHKRQEGLIP